MAATQIHALTRAAETRWAVSRRGKSITSACLLELAQARREAIEPLIKARHMPLDLPAHLNDPGAVQRRLLFQSVQFAFGA
ncbi:MAG: hypothetical protein ACJ8C6_15115 [Microvirga sp.]